MFPLIRSLVLLLAAIAWLPASAQDSSRYIAGVAVLGNAPTPIQQEEPSTPEAAVEQQLTRILTSTGWYQDIRVTLRYGVVTIDGTANTAENRAWAAALAERLDGIIAVVNRMDVGADFATTFERTGAEFERLARRVEQIFPLLVLAIGIAVTTWLVATLVANFARRTLARRIASPLLLGVIVRLISVPVLLLGIYFVLQVAGLTRLAVTVLGGTGIVGIIVGFAFRDIAENFLASLLLSIRNPFKSGDLIEVAGQTGIVQNLNTRSTVLLTLEGNHVQTPNAAVFKSTITNYSSTPTRRAGFAVTIGAEESIARAQALIQDILSAHAAVRKNPEPLVLVDSLGTTSITLRVSYWFDGQSYSPAKTNSALLRLTRNALVGARRAASVTPRSAPVSNSTLISDDRLEATDAEGDLSSEVREVEKQSEGEVMEATENLLADQSPV